MTRRSPRSAACPAATDFDQPVDIFAMVQRARDLVGQRAAQRRPVRRLPARKATPPGIVLNADRSRSSLQRYTCAHELGHHVLGHASHLDEAEHPSPVIGQRATELAAQAFAGAFLMPLQGR